MVDPFDSIDRKGGLLVLDDLLDLLSKNKQQQPQHQSEQVILQHEEEVGKHPFDVTAWVSYLDTIDDLIASYGDNVMSSHVTANGGVHDVDGMQIGQLLCKYRDLVGRRSVQLLPRSFKLWKVVWEYLLQQHQKLVAAYQKQRVEPQAEQPAKQPAEPPKSSSSDSTLMLLQLLFPNRESACHEITSCFEQAIVTLSPYPRVWIAYLQWWMEQYKLYQDHFRSSRSRAWLPSVLSPSRFRCTINRALESVAVTQHEKLWQPHLVNFLFDWNYQSNNTPLDRDDSSDQALDYGNGILPVETSYRLLRRYCLLSPASTVSVVIRFAKWCEAHGRYGPAAVAYMCILNGNDGDGLIADSSTSNNETQYSCWREFCELITEHSETVQRAGVPWESILRTAIERQLPNNNSTRNRSIQHNNHVGAMVNVPMKSHTEIGNDKLLLGLLYSQLANAWICRGQHDLARSVYEEGMRNVCTVRDFSILFASYLQLEENIVTVLSEQVLQAMQDDNDDNPQSDSNNNNNNNEVKSATQQQTTEEDLVDDESENDWDILLCDEDNQDDQDDNEDGHGIDTYISPHTIMEDDTTSHEPLHDQELDQKITTSTTPSGKNQRRLHSSKKRNISSSDSKLTEVELAIARAEHLTQRRPLLLNAVRLRQNPLSIQDWLERAELYCKQQQQVNNHLDDNHIDVTADTTAIMDENKTSKKSQHQQLYEYAAAALEEGLRTVSSHSVNNSSCPIGAMVRKLVQIYENLLGDTERAVELLERICRNKDSLCITDDNLDDKNNHRHYNVANLDDATTCWTEYIEFMLRHGRYDEALMLARESVNSTMKSQSKMTVRSSKQQRNKAISTISTATGMGNSGYTIHLHRSLRLWDLLLDLEENLGTIQTTKDMYNRVVESKVATIQHVLNYASFLTDHEYYEESFAAYEKGIELFDYQTNAGTKVLWKTYLQAFVQRYSISTKVGTSKLERTRHLFQRCLEQCPPNDCAEFFIMYGRYEEEQFNSSNGGFGTTTSRILSVYRDMCHSVPVQEKYTAYQLFIIKTIQYAGILATRDVYQEAIDALQQQQSPDSAHEFCNMCIEFATMEASSLNEIERARAIWVYGSHRADPRRIPNYWKQWNAFEIRYGNEDTFREMLRTKRAVEASFSTIHYNAAATSTASGDSNYYNNGTLSNEEAIRLIAAQEGVDYPDPSTLEGGGRSTRLQPPPAPIAGFVPAATMSNGSGKRGQLQLEDVEARAAKLRRGLSAVTNIKNRNAMNSHDEDEIELLDDEEDVELDIGVTRSSSSNNRIESESDKGIGNDHSSDNGGKGDVDEIDIDDIDAEIEAAAAEGAAVIEAAL